jgi:hypothetical protein
MLPRRRGLVGSRRCLPAIFAPVTGKPRQAGLLGLCTLLEREEKREPALCAKEGQGWGRVRLRKATPAQTMQTRWPGRPKSAVVCAHPPLRWRLTPVRADRLTWHSRPDRFGRHCLSDGLCARASPRHHGMLRNSARRMACTVPFPCRRGLILSAASGSHNNKNMPATTRRPPARSHALRSCRSVLHTA